LLGRERLCQEPLTALFKHVSLSNQERAQLGACLQHGGDVYSRLVISTTSAGSNTDGLCKVEVAVQLQRIPQIIPACLHSHKMEL